MQLTSFQSTIVLPPDWWDQKSFIGSICLTFIYLFEALTTNCYWRTPFFTHSWLSVCTGQLGRRSAVTTSLNHSFTKPRHIYTLNRVSTLFEQPLELIRSIDQLFDLFVRFFWNWLPVCFHFNDKALDALHKRRDIKKEKLKQIKSDWLPITDQWSSHYTCTHCMCIGIRKSSARYVFILTLRGTFVPGFVARSTDLSFVYLFIFLIFLTAIATKKCASVHVNVCAHISLVMSECWRVCK